MKAFQVGIQMFTLRDALKQDFEGTLRKVKELGYDYVEFAGYYGNKTAEELKALLDEIGLKTVSVHQGIDYFVQNGKEGIDFFKTLGIRYIVIPGYDRNRLAGSPEWEASKELFRTIGELCLASGMELLYHNHEFELAKIGEDRVYDLMFADTVGFMNPQPDTCWLLYGGVDPAAYIRKYGDRIHVVHLKDFVCDQPGNAPVELLTDEQGQVIDRSNRAAYGFHFVPLGQGRNDFSSILKASEDVGAEYVIYEQDSFVGITPLEAAAASRNYLKQTFGF